MRTQLPIVVTLAAGLSRRSGSSQALPDILLITWDTVSRSRRRHWTPIYNRLAQRAVVFPEARTTTRLPCPPASMMTGEPPVHGARDNGTWPMVEPAHPR